MNTLSLSLAYLRCRGVQTAFSVLLFALGIAVILAMLMVSHQLSERMRRDAGGFDLVAGAKGSPLQLVLSGIYHADVPTGNIALKDAQALSHHPLVAQAIPLALGDSVQGFRIVGTTPEYAMHYGAALARGAMFANPMEAVLGADVARAMGSQIGDRFVGSHGMTEGGEAHEHSPYVVSGILAPTASVLDRLVLTPVESVWEVHAHDEDEPHDANAEREITALLMTYKTPMAAASLPRMINTMTNMQAASPATESARLFSLMGIGADALQWLAFLLIAASALGVLAALLQSMHERRYDIALLRALGCAPAKIVMQLLTEGLLIALAGVMLGFVFAHGGVWIAAHYIPQLHATGLTGTQWIVQESYVFIGALACGAAAALWPALLAYRLPVSRTLAA